MVAPSNNGADIHVGVPPPVKTQVLPTLLQLLSTTKHATNNDAGQGKPTETKIICQILKECILRVLFVLHPGTKPEMIIPWHADQLSWLQVNSIHWHLPCRALQQGGVARISPLNSDQVSGTNLLPCFLEDCSYMATQITAFSPLSVIICCP